MDRTFVRNFLFFVVILTFCASILSTFLINSDQELEKTDDLILHTHEIIMEAEQLSGLFEGMLASQRGFLLTQEADFMTDYENKKAGVSEHIATLLELTADNKSQESRLNELRTYFTEFSTKLEERARRIDQIGSASWIQELSIIDSLKDNIVRINTAVLNEEYKLLDERVKLVERKKGQYFYTLLIGIFVGTLLLLIFNGFLLHAQRKRNRIETSLKDTEERFALAIDGTQDGIFDWDLTTDKVFYSQQYFRMLGYDNRKSTYGTPQEFTDLLHPEDVDRVWAYVDQYLNQQLSEYCQEFRLRHETGRWVWIQASAKALFDRDGKPYRIVGAHTDITHIVKTQEKLEAEKQQALEANEAKSSFLAHMSHEIRTPLTAISGIAEILTKNQDDLDEKQQRLVKTLNASSSALKDLINDILDFSKIEGGDLELDEQVFALDMLFEEIISMMSLRASEKGVSFVYDNSKIKEVDFYGDKNRLRQIVVNLIGNALKFTDEGGVTIQTSFEDRDNIDFLRIDVADTGIGIAPENFDMVFERFKQGDSTVSRKYGGTGLGLPISRSLAQLMGGDIFISSEVGKGSTFSVLLPMKIEHKKQRKTKTKDFNKKLSAKIQSELKEETRALLVEDYEGNIVVIGCLLEDINLPYDVAKNGLEAVNMWKNGHYDLILMDVQMPEMDGFAATAEIRRIEEELNFVRTPVIGMTAHALVGDKSKCIAAGMDAYLPKPLVEEDLKREILKYISQKRKAA